MPLPREETTPPVMKMYFIETVAGHPSGIGGGRRLPIPALSFLQRAFVFVVSPSSCVTP